MFKNKLIILGIGFLLVITSGCYKVATLVIEDNQEITTPVSLANDLQPIFDKSCTSSGCHNTGGKVPNLSRDKSYTSLVDGGYVNVDVPKSSELYLWLTGVKTPSMPIGVNNPSNINNLVLAWIKQGAKNN